ncbi:MAG: T9SS type A sorting domain-containing protein [Bacteroidota bacterium]|nr:T9SS type A sorting domain-containing protein [Bacteroidota bacterium]
MKRSIKFLAVLIVIIISSKMNGQCYAYAGQDVYFCCPGTTTLNATISTTAQGCTCTNYSYSWSPTTGLSDPTSPTPTATLSNITYTVCITAYTGHHCPVVCCVACDQVSLIGVAGCCRLTGLDESSIITSNIIVYPNPVKNILNIRNTETLNNAEFNLFDVSGKLVWKKENVSGKNNLEINVSNFPRGIYFIKTTEGGKEIYTNKVILE